VSDETRVEQARIPEGAKTKESNMSRLPLPPFTPETAVQKAQMAEDAWNTRDPVRVALACGIVFFLFVAVASAEDSADKGHIDAKSFRCITEMTHVRQFYVDNLLGNLDATLAVANSPRAVRIHRAPSYN
jgi:uncharacterized protein (DUF2342 family)